MPLPALEVWSHGSDTDVFQTVFSVHRVKPTHTMVNCWFCNHDTLVPYGNRNCWDCPHCEQYNGFQEVWAGSGSPELTFHATVSNYGSVTVSPFEEEERVQGTVHLS